MLYEDRQMFDYHGSRWKKKRKYILHLDGFKCQIDKMYGKTTDAEIVHHIYPADEYPEYAWCNWNLISVSKANHNRLENRKTGRCDEDKSSFQGFKKKRSDVKWTKWSGTLRMRPQLPNSMTSERPKELHVT